MKSLKTFPRYMLVCVIVFVGIAALMVIASPKLRSSGGQPEAKQDVAPKVISKIKGLEVVSSAIKRQGEPGATVVIEIRNNSDKPIVAIAVESGDGKDASGVSTDGFKGGDEPPSVILQPRGTITMEIAVNDLLPGKPLTIAGVMYADGTEDGDEFARKTLQGHRERARTQGKAQEGGPHR